MLRKVAVSFALLVLASTTTAMAADEISRGGSAAEPAAASSDSIRALLFEPPEAGGRGRVLPSLYVGLAGLNAYDAYTTLKGVSRGAIESNSLIRAATGTPAAIWALKGGVTAGSILVSERLWRSGRRAQAIGMMVASNAVMAMVSAHNRTVLSHRQ